MPLIIFCSFLDLGFWCKQTTLQEKTVQLIAIGRKLFFELLYQWEAFRRLLHLPE
uniref:Uncharacterized protein n=1 Tax=Octopus bimaculoides TaxID=37653 RepID=A0A0L8I2V9_OCTBM